MENLWPDDLLAGREKHKPNEIELVLQAQADGIDERTRGMVIGHVEDKSVAPGRAWALQLYPAHQRAKKTDLFIVRSADGGYPAVIETFDPEQIRHKKINGLSAFRLALQEIFLAAQTKRIVKLLFDEAKNAGAQERDSSSRQEAQEARQLLLGSVIDDGARMFCTANLLGVDGFIDATHFDALLLDPYAKKSPIEILNNHYVVKLEFLGQASITLTRDELLVLQAEIRKATASMTTSLAAG